MVLYFVMRTASIAVSINICMVLYLVLAGLVKEWLSLPTGATWSTPLTSSMALNWVAEGEFALFVGQTQKNLKILYKEYMVDPFGGHTI